MINSPCTGNYPSFWSNGQKRLASKISSLLSNNLGASPIPLAYSAKWPGRHIKSPFLLGLLASLIYIFLFCGAQYLVGNPNQMLLLLSLWGGCYLGFAVIIARFTSQFVRQTITDNIIAKLNDDTAAAIADELNDRFKESRIRNVSLGISAVGAVVSGIALAHGLGVSAVVAVVSKIALTFDLSSIGTAQIPSSLPETNPSSPPETSEIAIWSLGFFILYVLAARVTDVARFYRVFAKHLQSQSNSIFTLDPAHSVLVIDIASIGRRILFFWFGIALSIVTLVPLFSHLELFILIVVPTTMFFSIAFGTIVFLAAESAIRHIVRDKTSSTLAYLEQEITRLFHQRDSLTSSQWEEFAQLKTMHKELSSAGGHHSYLLSLLSLLSPLIGPAVAAVAIYVKYN